MLEKTDRFWDCVLGVLDPFEPRIEGKVSELENEAWEGRVDLP